ncbi:hypothetical protein RJ641_033132 [Dillenia turbinata]|uniref:Coiled-coil SMC6 And NSE5 INteracting (CANIN) domain-containing protein n=1 Tax=Dillenia turbinata TaxID=194707 RepID=A0AAN8VZ28_9MAGN
MEDGALDIELEDPISRPRVSANKRRKIIGLDDLLTDFYKEQSKHLEKQSKREKPQKSFDSDDDDDTAQNSKEALLSQYVVECQQKMEEISSDDDISSWGMQVFGDQKTPPPLKFPELQSCSLLNSFQKNELNSLVELSLEKGEGFLEGLLINGWLLKLALTCGHVEQSIATWTFYSMNEGLRSSACEFWCAILASNNKVDQTAIRIDWLPSFAELKRALETYGFLLDSTSNVLSNVEPSHADSDTEGPPQNIRAWIKFVAAACQARSKTTMFSTVEVEELVGFLICFFLDRVFQGLSVQLHHSMVSALNYFTDEEWCLSCERISNLLSSRVPKDLNCLRILECISGPNARCKQFRSAVAYQLIITCLDGKVTDTEDILKSLISINVKDKSCDLFKTYICLVLAENWLLFGSLLEEKPYIEEMWNLCLRNCSCQITSTDLRLYASKVRNKASYLLQEK